MKYQAPPLIVAALQDLGQNLAAARQRRGYSQADLAARAGLSRDTVYRAEQGRPVGSDALAALLHVLGGLDDFSSLVSLLRDSTGRALAEQAAVSRANRRALRP